MTKLLDATRILLGPGPSMTSPRVMRAMAAPTVSHLDPIMLGLLDDIRGWLGRLFQAPDGSFAFAVSGTGTSGMGTLNAVRVPGGGDEAAVRKRLLEEFGIETAAVPRRQPLGEHV